MMVRGGILPALVTPFDDRGRFAPKPFERLLARVYAAGVDGVYVCGTTGEGLLQSTASRQAVVEAAVAGTPPDRQVIVHVGAASLEDAIALAAHAARSGAHAVSSLPPIAGRFPFEEIRRYYQVLAEASALPLVLYFFPEVCPGLSTGGQLEDLCGLPHVAGVKFTDMDLFALSRVARSGLVVFNGRDEVLAAGLLMGASGGIGTFYNLVPELFVQVRASAEAGDWETARLVQQRINTLIALTLRFPLFPAVKQMLAWSGIDCGTCLPPRGPLTAIDAAALRSALTAAGFV